MCSIAAYTGMSQAAAEVTKSLSQMTYRGYDSSGIAVWEGDKTAVMKTIGTDLDVNGINGFTGIGQTRWATHGANDMKNTNPQTSGNDIAAVMNGTISNYYEIKDMLKDSGYELITENDTEVLAHLAHMFHGDMQKIMNVTKGRFSCIIMYYGRLGCIRRGPSLSVGKADDGMHVASDSGAFSRQTDMVYNMPNGTYAYIFHDICMPFNSDGSRIGFRFERVAMEMVQEHANTALSHTESELLESIRLLSGASHGWKMPDGNVAITGSGSSYHAALLAEYLMRMSGRMVDVFPACEYESHPPVEIDTLVAISQSGETGDVLRAVESYAGISRVVAITNNMQSSLTALADHTIPLKCGREVGVAATKSFMVQSGILMESLGMPAGKITPSVEAIPNDIIGLISAATDIYVLGSGIQHVAALEGALKIKELLYAHAEAMYAGEFKHGPLALLEEGTPVIILDAFHDSADTIQEVMARGGHAIVVSENAQPPYTTHIPLNASENIQDIFMQEVWLLQMMAIQSAYAAHRNVDRPRNIAKCVTI